MADNNTQISQLLSSIEELSKLDISHDQLGLANGFHVMTQRFLHRLGR